VDNGTNQCPYSFHEGGQLGGQWSFLKVITS
jgi:hypothetical protein